LHCTENNYKTVQSGRKTFRDNTMSSNSTVISVSIMEIYTCIVQNCLFLPLFGIRALSSNNTTWVLDTGLFLFCIRFHKVYKIAKQ